MAPLGDRSLGCAKLGDPPEFARPPDEIVPFDVRIPGCPPDPETIERHLIAALEYSRQAR